MKLPILKLTNDIKTQINKIYEELSEVEHAYSRETPDRFALEVLDLGQAYLRLLLQTFEDLDDAKEYIDEHCKKLKDRGWEFKGEIEISFKFK